MLNGYLNVNMHNLNRRTYYVAANEAYVYVK
ncbi:N-acetylmuramoyl-L-alanine amidase [Bacillus toyonensis]|nr:N-acetylmuramoyl-L-alanine amidase [Bacillus toyonensis]